MKSLGESNKSEGAVLRFETALNDGSRLLVYRVDEEYALCIIDEKGFGCKWFQTIIGLRHHVKVKYGIRVRLK